MRTLDSLIAQARRCGGDRCRQRCRRCRRGIDYRRRNGGAA